MNKFQLLFLISLVACGDPDTSLLDNLEITPIVNPNVGILIDGDYLQMMFSENNKIVGLSSSRTFNTASDFQNFQVSDEITFLRNISFYGKPSINFVNDGSAYIYEERGSLTIYNISNLEQLEDMEIKRIDTDLWAPNIESIEVLSNSKALLLGGSSRIYELDLINGDYSEISIIENYRSIDFSFFSELNGYVILTDDPYNYYKGLYVSKTLDGGYTWSEPIFINNNNSYFNIITPSENVVILYSNEFEREITVSTDGGISWNNVAIGNTEVRDVTFVSSNMGFAMDFALNIYKTTNYGISWAYVGKVPLPEDYGTCCFNDLIFYDESNGIAYNDNMVYRTYNGGRSWTPIIFPYDYVTTN